MTTANVTGPLIAHRALQPDNPPSAKTRIAALEGLRAYAICLVFLVHFLVQYFNGAAGRARIDFDAFTIQDSTSAFHLLAYYLWASHYGVDLFFLISGFLIFRMIARAEFAYGTFIKNRFIRLYPAFMAAVIVYLLYIAHFWGKTFEWRVVAQNLLLLHGIFGLRIEAIILPTWSLTFEWLFYLLFPVVFLMRSRRAVSPVWFACTVAVCIIGIAIGLGAQYMRLLMFIAGALLASLSAARVTSTLEAIPDVVVIGLYASANLLFLLSQNWYHFIPIYFLTCFLLVAKAINSTGIVHRIFTIPWLRSLGNVSYSFYLFHGIAIIVVCDHGGRMLQATSEASRFALLIIGSFGLSTVLAAVSFRLFEQPYFRRRACPHKVEARPQTSGVRIVTQSDP